MSSPLLSLNMKFEDVLLSAGEFGRYQKRLLAIVCLTGGFVIIQNMSPTFTLAIPRHRCQVPGLPNDTYKVQSEQHEWLINRSIPLDSKGDYSQCTVYDVTDPEAAGAEGVNRTERQCERWVYDRSVFTETLTSQLDLVCDKKIYRSHSSMMMFVGKLTGAFIVSISADYFGRRRIYTFTLMAMVASSLGIIFVSSLPALMAMRFMVGGTTTACYLCTYVMGMEMVGRSHRRFISITFKLASEMMDCLALLSAYLIRHWQPFQASLAAPAIVLVVGFFFIPESPRWLMSKGRTEEAQTIMEHVARVNGVTDFKMQFITQEELQPEEQQEKKQKDKKENEKEQKEQQEKEQKKGQEDKKQEKEKGQEGQEKENKEKGEQRQEQETKVATSSKEGVISPWQLFRIPRLFIRYNALFLSWICIIMNIYGLMLNVSTMKGSIYQNYAILIAMDLCSVIVFILFVERLGRRLLLGLTTGLGGLACLATIVPTVLGADPWYLRALSMVGRMGMSASLSTIYVLSPELYPTVLRSFGLGACSMVSRLGGIASPYVADLNLFVGGVWGPALPQAVFGLAGLVVSAMMVIFPETRGRRLPETVEDAAHFGSKDRGKDEREMTLVI